MSGARKAELSNSSRSPSKSLLALVTRSISEDRLQADVAALSSPRSRFHALAGMAHAEDHIAGELKKTGLPLSRLPYHVDHFEGVADYLVPSGSSWKRAYRDISGANLLAVKEGSDPSLPPILLGAHLDTVKDSPGADDNASGIAGLLEVARILMSSQFKRTVILAFFDMEEIGFLGSRMLARETTPRDRPAAVIVLESIGYYSAEPGIQKIPPGAALVYFRQVRQIKQSGRTGEWPLVVYRNSSAHIAGIFAEAMVDIAGDGSVIMMREPTDLPVLGPVVRKILPWASEFSRSDHRSFWDIGVQAIQVTDTADFRNPHYHDSSDLPETLNYRRMADVVAASAVTVAHLAGIISAGSSDPRGHPR